MAENTDAEKILSEENKERARLDQVTRDIFIGRRSARMCDKCNLPVPSNNDATILDLLLGRHIDLMFTAPRHLLPVVENSIVVCEGSPSRAQYLSGQPRDNRLSYPYQPEMEVLYREAYKKLQHKVAA